jgi:hypothetical protein
VKLVGLQTHSLQTPQGKWQRACEAEVEEGEEFGFRGIHGES